MSAKAVIGLAIIPLLGVAAVASYINATHTEKKTIFVESKERLLRISSDKDGSRSSYENFVYASDETYVVKDSLWNGHFRAGTVYAKVREKASCAVTITGYRIGFISLYQNIIAADCSQEASHVPNN